jgi:predicted AAA+ superfamily ATPase
VDTYLKEEIQNERLVRNLYPFHKFLQIAAQMNARPINYSAIARDVGLSDYAVRDYYSILVDTYLAFELPAWERSVRKRLKRASKFYFFDCGIVNAISGELSLEVRPGNRRYGSLFENFIIVEFFRQMDYRRKRKSLFYWEVNNTHEVDLLIDRGIAQPPIAIEIKSASEVGEDKIKGLRQFKKDHIDAELYCISRTKNPYEIDGIKVLPWEIAFDEILSRV